MSISGVQKVFIREKRFGSFQVPSKIMHDFKGFVTTKTASMHRT
jgi:hypothetical protein